MVTQRNSVFCQKAHKTQQITLFHPQKGGLSLTVSSKGQTYNPKCNPKRLSNQTMRFLSDGHVHSMHNTAKFLIGSSSKIDVFHWS